jgi:hypothetical protein
MTPAARENYEIGRLIKEYKLALINNRTRALGTTPEWVAACDTQTVTMDNAGNVISPQPGKSDDLLTAIEMAVDNIERFRRELHACL